MRSRDGDNSLLCRFSIIFFLFAVTIFASEEYLVSYRYVVRDAMLYNEELSISKAMTKCEGKELKALILSSNSSKDFKGIIEKNYMKFLDFIQKLGLHVRHRGKTTNSQNASATIVTLRTTCFKVDFNDNFVKITPLKK